MPEHTPAPTPSRGVYGFVMYLSFQLFFILYLIWALIPEKYFVYIGVTFLPDRHWAITVPVYLLTVLTIFAFIIYPSFGLCMTPNVDNFRTIRDNYGSDNKRYVIINTAHDHTECICADRNACCKGLKKTENSKKFISDLNIWDVSEHLYLK